MHERAFFGTQLALVAVLVLSIAVVTPSTGSAAEQISASQWAHHPRRLTPLSTADDCELDITTNVRLHHDVACRIVVEARNVVVDLNHHTASGGILGGSAVTIRNGRVTDFVWVGARSTIEHVAAIGASDNAGLPALQVGPDSVVRDNRFVGNAVAIDLFYDGDRDVIIGNLFERNDTALWNNRAVENVVARNQFIDNGAGVAMFDEDEGGRDVFHNTITSNAFRGNVVGVVAGAWVGVRQLTIDHNTFRDNQSSGVSIQIGCHPTCGGAGMRVFANTFVHNGYDPNGGPDAGLSATAELFGNPTKKGVRHVTVSDNTAIANAGLGIDANGAIDGGGNVARRNGNAAQCVSVVCTPEPLPLG